MSKAAFKGMNTAWIHLWFLFLKQNKDYAAYCKAKRKKQNANCTKLEKKFKKIAQVYDDFGTVYGVNFANWHKSHKHLFYPPVVSKVQSFDKAPLKLDPNSVHLCVPLSLPVSQATKQAMTAIRAAYDIAPAAKKKPKLAKYPLSHKTPSVTAWVSTFKCYASFMYSLHYDAKKFTEKQIVTQLIKVADHYADEYWDWPEQDMHLRGGFDDETRKVMQKNKLQAKAIIANTIHGVFPVKIPPK